MEFPMKHKAILFALAATLAAQNALAQKIPADTGSTSAVSLTRPDCSVDDRPGDCEEHAAIFTHPTAKNGRSGRGMFYNAFNTYGPSVSFGNAGGWTVTHVYDAPRIIFGTSGIDQYQYATITKNGVGDLAGIDYYVHGGGRSAQSDEGVEGLVIESGEIDGYFHGVISSPASRGATSLTLTDPNPQARLHWNATCNGCMLLDITKGTIAGSLNGRSQHFGNTFLYQLPTTAVTVNGSPARLPLSRAWCTTLAAIPPTDTAGSGTSRPVNCTLGAINGATPAFTAGGVVTIAGQFYPEQATLTGVGRPSGGVQALTLLARNPNPAGSAIFQGGIAGQSLSFDDNLAASGFRSSYYVFGSVDGVNLIYGSESAGSLINNQLPRINSEAETTSSGFHLYPSAEIVANTAAPAAPVLEPNDADWAQGDIVEDPRYQSFGGWGMRDVCSAYTPYAGNGGVGCLYVQMAGDAVSGGYVPFQLDNYNKIALYRQGGGNLDPVPAMKFGGPFGNFFVFHNAPSSGSWGTSAVIDVQNTATGDNTPFNLFSLPSARGGGAASVTYDPSTKLIEFPQGLTAGTLGTSANCSSAAAQPNCGQAASGSIAIPAGVSSVTVVTSAVTANSQILVTPDASLSAKLNISCNRNPAQAFAPFGITARTPGRSFTLAIAATAEGSPNCYSYSIIN
jgi:hypothetical protein